MIGRFLIWLFGPRRDHPDPIAQVREERVQTLRDLEREEREAVRRVVHEGARAAIEADKATETAKAITRRISPEDESVLTADLALRLLDRGRTR